MTRWRFLSLALWLSVGACATPGSTLGPSIGTIRSGVAAAQSGAAERFAEINADARSDAITLLLLNNSPPSEAAFAPIIAPDTAARWSAAFGAIDAYLAALQELVDDGRTSAIGGDLKSIADTIQSPNFGARLPAGAAGLFASAGQALLQASAERKAQSVMQRFDPAFGRLMRGLGDLVVRDDSAAPGTLRALVDEHWVAVLGGIENDYKKVATQPADARRPLFERYAAAIDGREAQRQKLARLRSALLAIAEAHAAAARGSGGGTLFWLNRIAEDLKKARDEAGGGK